MAGAVSYGGSTTDSFGISHEQKSMCFAPTFLTLFLASLLSTESEHLSAESESYSN